MLSWWCAVWCSEAPSLSSEPPAHVAFYNGTGAAVPCEARGGPGLEVRWLAGPSLDPRCRSTWATIRQAFGPCSCLPALRPRTVPSGCPYGSVPMSDHLQGWCSSIPARGRQSRTISRRLVANGLHSCRPLRRLPLTTPNRRQRLEWCRARSTWMTEWHRVVFSDESRFCLSSDSRRVRVWRRRGERSNPAAIVERPTVRQRGIMVWGAIAYDSRSPLLRIQGTMTAQRYVDDVLRPVTLPYLQGVPNALYQQDNARPHTARISQQALQDVQMLPWPPYSPDLCPIEHVWDIIGRRLHALPQPRSEDKLWQMVEREWRAIPQDAIRTLIDSLPRRVAACIAVRGGPTCY
ncbi:Transposase [Cordylochernes scorpioides]|uniref:Transposase n=1 Tax=Cordylochernes scorpioides TaxID=51811 RepID=A0ABY6K785_9ARAC|nr:Transposase [Cordylochernes scorpioides]